MSPQARILFVAMELSNKKWKLAMSSGERERQKTLPARDQKAFVEEITRSKEKLGLPADSRVVCCYEAGRDGFWIDRFLRSQGYENRVLDPASIEVDRRARRRKNDRLDAEKLLRQLIRKELWGEKKAFSVVRVPTREQEDQMRLYRERERLNKERTAHRARLRSLLVLHGIEVGNPCRVKIRKLRDWSGQVLPAELVEELLREQARLKVVEEQLKVLKELQHRALAHPEDDTQRKVQKLYRLKGLGPQSSWVLTYECFGWRTFRNRKHLGSFAGLTGTPYDSGDSLQEQGISKAGSGRVRTAMIELAWGWLRHQPDSALSRWYMDRFASGSKRTRRMGIVALARKLLIALWKYLEQDELPEGAVLKV